MQSDCAIVSCGAAAVGEASPIEPESEEPPDELTGAGADEWMPATTPSVDVVGAAVEPLGAAVADGVATAAATSAVIAASTTRRATGRDVIEVRFGRGEGRPWTRHHHPHL